MRQIEIDVFADAKGGRYAHLPIDDAATKAGLPPDPDFDPQHEMEKPGFKVMHAVYTNSRDGDAIRPFAARWRQFVTI